MICNQVVMLSLEPKLNGRKNKAGNKLRDCEDNEKSPHRQDRVGKDSKLVIDDLAFKLKQEKKTSEELKGAIQKVNNIL